MYAIFKDGGHQHKAEVGRKMFIELRKDVNVGDTIEFNEVLLVGSEEGVAVGQPNVEGVSSTPRLKSRKSFVDRRSSPC